MTKQCGKCKETKDVKSFHKKGTGWASYCKLCNKEHKRNWIKNNKVKVNNNRMWSRHRLRKSDFIDLLRKQNNKCVLCPTIFDELNKPNIDHKHSCCGVNKSCTKCRRGLLCHKCNIAVGWIESNKSLLDRIISYVA